MAHEEIKYDDFKVKAFLDTNIILECHPLAELPWQEIDSSGPILALVTPTSIKEIDSKKQDGRIGKRAREFNRIIAPAAAGGPPIVIRKCTPRVELALSRAVRIPWDQHHDLDPSDGDSCIVAEILYAMDMNSSGKLIISHDIKPIALASYYDISTFHVSDSWLRSPEPHPKERELQKLKRQLTQYQITEPAFEIDIELFDHKPAKLVRIEDLSDAERATIQHRIHELNPPYEQKLGPYGLALGYSDHSYEKRFKAYQKRIPYFMAKYEQRMEHLFNQSRFNLKVVNTSRVQAENLLVEVSISNGWVHDRFAFVSPQGPTKPTPREINYIPPITTPMSVISSRVGRHEFGFKDAPNFRKTFSVTCEDFRHKQEYVFEGLVCMDARASEVTEISVSITASNFHGPVCVTKSIERNIETLNVSDLIDLKELRFNKPIPMQELIENQNYEAIDWKALEDDNLGDT